MNILDQKKRT
jgi:hypothetical protein